MSVLIGLGLIVGGVAVLLTYCGICLLIGESEIATLMLGVVFVLSLANLMGAGLIYDPRLPLWGWLPAAISGGLLFGVVFMTDDGGW